MRRDRGEDVAAVESSAEGVEEIAFAGDVAYARFFLPEDHREHAVIRSYEIVAGGFRQQGPAR